MNCFRLYIHTDLFSVSFVHVFVLRPSLPAIIGGCDIGHNWEPPYQRFHECTGMKELFDFFTTTATYFADTVEYARS